MKKKALRKDFYMEIRKSLNRFLSILLIVALGVAFYSGIQSAAPDMRYSGDAYFDEHKLMDLKVIGTLGLTEEDVTALSQVEGIYKAEPGYMTDVLCGTETQKALHLESISKTLNQLTPIEGRLPEASGECFVDIEFLDKSDYKVGDSITFFLEEEEDFPLKRKTFTIVGAGSSPLYISFSRGNTTLGNGELAGVGYILPEDFDQEVYTQIYIEVSGARDLTAYTDAYDMLIEHVMKRVEAIEGARCEVRYEEVMDEAKEKLADAKKELEDGRKEGESELAEAESELADGKKELEDGKKELADAKKELADGEKELADGEKELKDNKATLAQKEQELADGKAKLADGWAQLNSGKRELAEKEAEFNSSYASAMNEITSGEQQLAQARQELASGKKEYEAGAAQYEEGKKQYQEGETQYRQGLLEFEKQEKEWAVKKQELETQRAGLLNNQSQLEAALPQIEAQLTQLQEQKKQAQGQRDTLKTQRDELQGQRDGLQTQLDALNGQIAGLNVQLAALGEEQGSLQETAANLTAQIDGYSANAAELNGKLASADVRIGELTAQKESLSARLSELESQEAPDAAEIENVRAQLGSVQSELDAAAGERAAAQETLAQVNGQLEAAQTELGAAQNRLNEIPAEQEAAQGMLAQCQGGITPLTEGLSQADAGLSQMDDGLAQADAGLASLQAGIEQIQNEQTTQTGNLAKVKEGIAQIDSGISGAESQLAAGRAQLNESRAQLDAAKKELEATLPQLEQARKEIADGEQEIAANEKKLADGRAQLADAQAQLADAKSTIAANEQTLISSQTEITDGEKQLADARKKIADAEKEIADAKKEIADGKKEIADAEKEIKDGEKELADGQKEYEDGKKEFEEEIADAEQKIADAEQEIADIKKPEWLISDRSDLPENIGYGENADRMRNIGQVFPVLFFLVAALISLTTMTRMVEEERTQIGTLKALGYSKWSIASKYLCYALIATLAGSIIGILFGEKFLPFVIVMAYKIIYHHMPNLELPYNMTFALIATGAALFSTMFATFAACYKELASTPAVLMRPPAPKEGKRVLLEYVPFLWKHLSFSWKSTVRNLFRYKKRFFMTILGIGGCMALMIVGYGLRDSIMDIANLQFEELQVYDGMLILDIDASKQEEEELDEAVSKESRIQNYTKSMMRKDAAKVGKKRWDLYLMVPENVEEFSEFINFRNRLTGETYELTDEGAIITEKIAKQLKLKPGDTIAVENEDYGTVEVPVAAVTENYLSHYIYITPSLYEKCYKEKPVYDQILYRTEESEAMSVGEKLMTCDAALSVSYTATLRTQLDDMLVALDSVMIVLIVSAGLLAFVVLYNLNNININERKRELATIKVLGFYNHEVDAYVYRENILLTIIGIFVGVGLGTILHRFVITTVEVDACMFGRNINLPSFLISAAYTAGFSAFVNAVMHFKLKKIDMVESLKSVE